MFVGLVDFDLILMMPKLMKSPHVQLDPCIQLLYHHIVYFGWMLGDQTSSANDRKFATKIYSKCLTLAEASKNGEDLIPRLVNSVLMVSLAH